MPPKKSAKSKSVTQSTKEVELAQEMEKLAFEKERERLRNEELMLRQRLEEEERKLLEDHRSREREIRNAVAERDRQADYATRERELTDILELRERGMQELRAKILCMQQSMTELENEKQSAQRRAATLMTSWETTKSELAAAQERLRGEVASRNETLATSQSQYAALNAELAATRISCEEAREQNAQLSKEIAALSTNTSDAPRSDAAVAQATAGVTSTDGDQRSVDAESAVLLSVLHEEVEKYRSVAAALQSEVDRKSRDEEKSSLLIGILNTQLESVREENKRLHAKATKMQDEAKAVHESALAQKEHDRTILEGMDRASSDAIVERRQLELEIGVHKRQVEELTNRLASLTDSHAQLQRDHHELSTRAAQREQDDFHANVTTRAELEKQKHDLARLLKEKSEVEEAAFDYKILTRAEMDGLRNRLQKFQETMERKERESYELTTALREELSTTEARRCRETDSLQLEVDRISKELSTAVTERDRYSTELAEKDARYSKTEREMYERLVNMTACHDARYQEAESLRERLLEKEETLLSSSIFANAEKENLKARIDELLGEAQKRRAEHLRHVEKMTKDVSELQTRMTNEAAQQDALVRRERSRAELAERNVARMQDQVREMTATARATESESVEALEAAKAHAKELRSELGIAKRTIERLEAAFGDQVGYSQLKELNVRLTNESAAYAAQAEHLNSLLTAMKKDQDVMGGYKLQKATDETERLARQLRQLEQTSKLTQPVVYEARRAVDQGSVDANLRRALERYDTQTAHLTTSSCPSTEAAATSSLAADDYGTTAADRSLPANSSTPALNATLPTVMRPRLPSSAKPHNVIELFYDRKKGFHTPTKVAAPTDRRTSDGGGELPTIGA